MKITQFLRVNLNQEHWDRRVWEIGYRGSPLAKKKVTGKPPMPVNDARIQLLRDRFEREYRVMRWLCTPYLTKETEKEYIEKYGTFRQQQKLAKKNEALSTMPGYAKALNTHGDAIKKFANYGNLMHKSRTVEDSLRMLINKNRWD